jgi:transcriptional regulator with PAS, ATPase and Fis domain
MEKTVMHTKQWIKELPVSITVCDRQGTILEMNNSAIKTFETDGGADLVGQNVLNCHPQRARELLEGMLASREKNVYTIEKDGIRKLIYQAPWFEDGEYAGFVELALPIPAKIPHFKR